MAGQRDPDRYGVMCYVPNELAAKMKSFIAGKTVAAKPRKGQKVHTPTRPMGMSDLLIALADERLKDQEVLPRFADWTEMIRRHNRKLRAAKEGRAAE